MLPLKNAGAFANTPQDGVPAKSNDFVGRGGAREQAQFSHKAETELSGLCDDDGMVEKPMKKFWNWKNQTETAERTLVQLKELTPETYAYFEELSVDWIPHS